MAMGLIGRKCGMTRVFTEDGVSIPVTVVEVEPNRITQIKTEATDGYSAIQVTTGSRRPIRVNKAMSGHCAKAGVTAGRGLWEFRVNASEVSNYTLGQECLADLFAIGQIVDVAGTSKGRGNTGTITRWNFGSQRASHGNSLSHNRPGSIGQNQTPGKVFKGKKMAGRWGHERISIQGLEIIRVDIERNALLIKGAIPGAPGGDVIIYPAAKAGKTTAAA